MEFLDAVSKNSKVKIQVRNVGSVNSFKNDIGEKYLDDKLLPFEDDCVAINITNDQIGISSPNRESISI